MSTIFDIFKTKDKQEEYGNSIPLGVESPNDAAQTIITNETFGVGDMDNALYSFIESFNNERELIEKYVTMSSDPYVSDAISTIIDEIVVFDRDSSVVNLNLDKLTSKEIPESTKKKIHTEFDKLVNILNFNQDGYDLVKDWYIKGKQYHYIVISKDKKSIAKVVQLSQQNVKEINHVTYKESIQGSKRIKTVDKSDRFFLYKLNSSNSTNKNWLNGEWIDEEEAFKFHKDTIIAIDSGIYDKSNGLILSQLHNIIKSYNHLSQSEDSMVIYRMVRAPEKRAFFIDTGSLGKQASEKYINQFIAKFKTASTYNQATGKLILGSKGIQSLYSDYWLPRKGNMSTDIRTLDSAQNLGEITDIEYLKAKLYTGLKIPVTRTDPEATYSLGRATEIQRDEFKFHKFIQRQRNRYSELFINLLRVQLELTGIMNTEDFDLVKNKIFIDWNTDNYFEEIKDQEILLSRLETIDRIESLEGDYFTEEFIHKNILMRSDKEYEEFINNKKESQPDDEDSEDSDRFGA